MDNNDKILVIDDELAPRESIRMVLKDHYHVLTASGAGEGLDMMSRDPVDLVVMDIKMPKMDGITALQQIKSTHPDTEVILLTAYASLETARDAIRFGAFDYLIKPFDKDDVIMIVEKGLEKRRTNAGLRLERDTLLDKTSRLESQISEARSNIMNYYDGTVKALIYTIDAKDHYTFNHSNRVAELASAMAKVIGVPQTTIKGLEHAASIHDIGKIGIDESILRKKGRLSPEEYEEVKNHPAIGARIVKSVPFLEEAVPVILYHHERFDGNGYPEGFRSTQIPLTARIVLVADAIDAMMSDRPYRKALPIEQVMSELKNNSGTQFDPVITSLVLNGDVPLQ